MVLSGRAGWWGSGTGVSLGSWSEKHGSAGPHPSLSRVAHRALTGPADLWTHQVDVRASLGLRNAAGQSWAEVAMSSEVGAIISEGVSAQESLAEPQVPPAPMAHLAFDDIPGASTA